MFKIRNFKKLQNLFIQYFDDSAKNNNGMSTKKL